MEITREREREQSAEPLKPVTIVASASASAAIVEIKSSGKVADSKYDVSPEELEVAQQQLDELMLNQPPEKQKRAKSPEAVVPAVAVSVTEPVALAVSPKPLIQPEAAQDLKAVALQKEAEAAEILPPPLPNMPITQAAVAEVVSVLSPEPPAILAPLDMPVADEILPPPLPNMPIASAPPQYEEKWSPVLQTVKIRDRKPPQQNTSEFPTTFKNAVEKEFLLNREFYGDTRNCYNSKTHMIPIISQLINVQLSTLFSKTADNSNIFHALFEALQETPIRSYESGNKKDVFIVYSHDTNYKLLTRKEFFDMHASLKVDAFNLILKKLISLGASQDDIAFLLNQRNMKNYSNPPLVLFFHLMPVTMVEVDPSIILAIATSDIIYDGNRTQWHRLANECLGLTSSEKQGLDDILARYEISLDRLLRKSGPPRLTLIHEALLYSLTSNATSRLNLVQSILTYLKRQNFNDYVNLDSGIHNNDTIIGSLCVLAARTSAVINQILNIIALLPRTYIQNTISLPIRSDNNGHRTALHFAAASGSVELIRVLLDGFSESVLIQKIFEPDSSGMTLLHHTLLSGTPAILAAVLDPIPSDKIFAQLYSHWESLKKIANTQSSFRELFPHPIEHRFAEYFVWQYFVNHSHKTSSLSPDFFLNHRVNYESRLTHFENILKTLAFTNTSVFQRTTHLRVFQGSEEYKELADKLGTAWTGLSENTKREKVLAFLKSAYVAQTAAGKPHLENFLNGLQKHHGLELGVGVGDAKDVGDAKKMPEPNEDNETAGEWQLV